MSYTHVEGVRNRYVEFSNEILQKGDAGILTRLDTNGNPVVSPLSNLSGVKIVDITGWAPTKDSIVFVENECTMEEFRDYKLFSTREIKPYPFFGYPNGSNT